MVIVVCGTKSSCGFVGRFAIKGGFATLVTQKSLKKFSLLVAKKCLSRTKSASHFTILKKISVKRTIKELGFCLNSIIIYLITLLLESKF